MNFLQKILEFLPFGRENKYRVLAHNLYVSLVTDARNPETFITCKIADTVDGRFDVIVLHLSLLLRRLKQAKQIAEVDVAEELERLSEELVGVYNTDMDRNLREIGVGDMSVGKHVKKMAKAFYGRLLAYDAALDQFEENGEQSMLRQALSKNIYRGEVADDVIEHMLLYVGEYEKYLQSVTVDELLKGNLPKQK